MKTINILSSVLVLLIAGCGSPELDKATVLDVLKKEQGYPRTVDYDIYCADPAHARRLLDAGLEDKGLVTVQRTQKLGDAGKPLIRFTEAAKPYLLPTPEKDRKLDVQKVKLADETLQGVTSIHISGDGKTATVAYETIYANQTPFSALRTNPTDRKTYTVHFLLTNEGWQMEKKR